MGRGKNKRRARRRNDFVALHALGSGEDNVSSLVKEAKRRGTSQKAAEARAQRREKVAKKVRDEADAVTELFLIGIPFGGTGAEIVKAIIRTLRLLDLEPPESPWRDDDVNNPHQFSTCPVLRCEIRKSKKPGVFSNAYISMRTKELAEALLLSKNVLFLRGAKITVSRSKFPSVPGVGSAWRTRPDLGSRRWKVGTVEVGESVADNTFSVLWSSSRYFDLTENSIVELNPVAHVITIIIGRSQSVLKADRTLQSYAKTDSMLRIELPFRSIAASPGGYRMKGSDHLAVHVPLSQPPLLFRSEAPTLDLTANVTQWGPDIWDYSGGYQEDIRWVRTVDPTPNAAFARAGNVRIVMHRSEFYGLFQVLHQQCIADLPRPLLRLGNTVREKEIVDRNAMFKDVANVYGLSFAVRYAVDCVLSIGTLATSALSPEFWKSLAYQVEEQDALITLQMMYERFADDKAYETSLDPLVVLQDCIESGNVDTREAVANLTSMPEPRDTIGEVPQDDSVSSSGTEDTEEFEIEMLMRELQLEDLGEETSRPASAMSLEGKAVRRSATRSSRQHVSIRRLIYTPTRCIATRPEKDMLNRVLREFSSHKDRFLRISFSDEDGGSIGYAGSDDLYARVRIALKDGVFVAGEKFVFLAFSNSQLRDHAVWMYNEASDSTTNPPTADEIREWMGDFSHIRVPGKYAARQGQAFSSTVGTVVLKDIQHCLMDDIHSPDKKYTFSDGVGVLSSSLARKVAEKLRIRHKTALPSAFQVRFGGAKGMLTVWDDALPARDTVEVAIRRSMKKFDCSHRNLEIVGYSKRLPAYLNRQIIMLLSALGVPDKAFEEMQRRLLRRLHHAMQRDGAKEALDLLYTSGCCDSDVKMRTCTPMMNAAAFFRAGLTCVNCEHLFNMMEAFRRRAIRELMFRARIPIDSDKGVCAIGVMDELSILEPGEVFCQYSDPASGAVRVVTGPVTVGRSPCLHPGDIQPLLAVDHEEFHHLVDVIVFPQKGNRPVPSMLSGGDLDGDLYFCIFDEGIAIQSRRYAPMDYTAKQPQELPHDVGTGDVADFFVEYIRHDKLGQIANAHVVHADRESLGVHSVNCLTLADLHSVAVDFAKTGVPATFPKQLYLRNQPGQYPDFMGRHPKVSYESSKVLGKLYRACNASALGRDDRSTFETNAESKKIDIIIDGIRDDPDVTIEAEKVCSAYNYDLNRIMDEFGVRTEGEVISGQVLSFTARHAQLRGRREYFALQMRLNRRASELRSRYRELFFEGLGPRSRIEYSPETIVKACAWYKACRRQAEEEREKGARELVSFPWVVSDVLLQVISSELRKEENI